VTGEACREIINLAAAHHKPTALLILLSLFTLFLNSDVASKALPSVKMFSLNESFYFLHFI